MWKLLTTLLLVAILFLSYVLVVATLECNGLPSYDRRILHGSGAGDCWVFTTPGDIIECCEFCARTTWEAIAAQLLLPGQTEPFENFEVKRIKCCCYTHGQEADGADGTQYYFK